MFYLSETRVSHFELVLFQASYAYVLNLSRLKLNIFRILKFPVQQSEDETNLSDISRDRLKEILKWQGGKTRCSVSRLIIVENFESLRENKFSSRTGASSYISPFTLRSTARTYEWYFWVNVFLQFSRTPRCHFLPVLPHRPGVQRHRVTRKLSTLHCLLIFSPKAHTPFYVSIHSVHRYFYAFLIHPNFPDVRLPSCQWL